MLIGQVYSPKLVVKEVDGKEKVSFTFSLGQPKAMRNGNSDDSMVFTRCVVYNASLAKVLNEHFGGEEHHGKPIAVYGRWHEYEVWADPSKPEHQKYCTEVTLTAEQLEAAGIRLAEGSEEQITLLLPTKRTVRELIVSGFEFVGYPGGATSAPTKTTKEKPSFVVKPKQPAVTPPVAETTEDKPVVDQPNDVVLDDDIMPF